MVNLQRDLGVLQAQLGQVAVHDARLPILVQRIADVLLLPGTVQGLLVVVGGLCFPVQGPRQLDLRLGEGGGGRLHLEPFAGRGAACPGRAVRPPARARIALGVLHGALVRLLASSDSRW